MRTLAVLAAFCTVICCGPQSGSVPVLIVSSLDDSATQFGLKVVHLPRLIDISKLRGERFIFKAGHSLSFGEYAQIYEEQNSFESARSKLFERVKLEDVQSRLSFSSGHYRPLDFDTLYMATAYYWLERVADFFVDVVKDRSEAVTTPVHVSVYGALTSRGFLRVPSGFVDNSAYLPMEDMFKMYRVAEQDGLPFEMNPGVVAHEFEHRVFHKLMFESKKEQGYALWRKISLSQNGLKYTKVRLFVKAIDEGLADVHAVAFSKNANFLKDALRDLNGDFARAATYDNLADASIESRFSNACHGEALNYTNPHWRYYCLGTVIAKTIWESAEQDFSVLNSVFLPAINQSLSGLSNALITRFEDFDLPDFWSQLLQRLASPFQQKLCTEIKLRFASRFSRIPECI